MKKNEIQISGKLYEYILSVSVREPDILRRLREETAKDPDAIMQIPPEQGQFMALLVKIIGAKRTLEIGTYTGYSALSVALAMPKDSVTIACDINANWTNVAQRYWKEAGVENKIRLHVAPAIDTLESLLNAGEAHSYDFAFIDADKSNYEAYYEKSLRLLRSGGVMAIDNVFLFGSVVDSTVLGEGLRARISDADISAIKRLNSKIKNDRRVEVSMLPIGDGLTVVRKQ